MYPAQRVLLQLFLDLSSSKRCSAVDTFFSEFNAPLFTVADFSLAKYNDDTQ